MALSAPFPTATGATLFQRIARLTFYVPQVGPVQDGGGFATILQITGAGDGSTPGLRIRAQISKTSEKEPNTCKITVTNLSPSTRQSLQTLGVKVLLEAGYQDTGMTGIFQGDVSFVDHLHPAADLDTVIKCRDGDLWYRWQRLNGPSFQRGCTVAQLVHAICDQTGMPFPAVVPVAAPTRSGQGWATPFQQGYTLSGTAQSQLDILLKGIGLKWSIQNGQLQILGPGQVLDTSIPVISPSTGLWGSAEMGTPETKGKPALLKFVSALVPVNPRGVVHLTDSRYDTDVTVVKAEFNLDTEGGPWDTTISGTIRT